MKKNNINTYFPNKNKWKGISITENAIKQILFLINSHSDNKGIRLGIKKSGCAGFRYTMKLIKTSELKKEKNKEEITFFYKNILIYISSKEMPFLEGIKIDFIKNNINKIFKFYNPKLEKFCGCGESFSIN
ncbi:MAG: iron-sulfur cluster assembly accessory protein [Buchnera aphidicola (Brevicoryne brassicae)]|uniref:Iron-sulfur cluster assembly accessory protein n=1 Tax=Buchnera aphidicola (Brevicoryne brassicae) TaxID=911343 RepID=A0AAJ5PVC6_9GAMM|nr:iron-sulfur cluster assembly accessory protein [Buchnera aphidicola]QCI19702.1 iron-sulfur cluster assembly accessory protein [Buchnera aphidicola (Brevicoryne brassicae)]WAI19072.1 MAG: iron-sulfur cluster assembly accessory protein [Buchnera aphidicola (Brevicoryne brassicae)]